MSYHLLRIMEGILWELKKNSLNLSRNGIIMRSQKQCYTERLTGSLTCHTALILVDVGSDRLEQYEKCLLLYKQSKN